MTAAAAIPAAPPRPWRRAALWLAGLGPFFYLTYGIANWLASRNPDVGAVVFAWERSIPFLAWTILPYWSVNAFYAASLFVCRSPEEVDTHGRRLLTAQVVAVACFIAFPLRFTFERLETSGVFGFMFDALASFDQPFNQAPSLHIALLVILWDLYARRLPRRWLPGLRTWFFLIGASVLTTYQHHFIDVPTGALLGFACLWLWPWEGSEQRNGGGLSSPRPRTDRRSAGEGPGRTEVPNGQAEAQAGAGVRGRLRRHHVLTRPLTLALPRSLPTFHAGSPLPARGERRAHPTRRRTLALRYALGAALLAALAAWGRGTALWLLWPSLSLAMVAANYAVFGAAGFQKGADGAISPASRWLLAPYRLAAWINSRAWTRRDERVVPIAAGVHLARMPGRPEAKAFARATLVDLSAELAPPRGFARVAAVPMLDLVTPDPGDLRAAADAVEHALRSGSVIVACALGYSRSAAVVAVWLVRSGRARGIEEAVGRVRAARPRIVLDEAALAAIREAAR